MNAEMSVLFLIEAGVKATLLFAAAALTDRRLRRASSATRHVVWTAALAGALLLAPLSLTVPAWQLPVDLEAAPALRFATDAMGAGTPASAAAAPRAVTTSGARIPWTSFALWIWLAGSLLMAARMAAGAWAMRRIATRAAAPPEVIAAPAADLARACGVRAAVRLAAPGAMPMTCGVLRPRVLLPAEAVSWPAGRLDAVLLHEFAHVRRRDTFWHAVGSLACAVFWPHPLAWSALRRALVLRERAADDFVLASGARASDYAGSLLEIARSLTAPRLCRSAAMAQPWQLEGRLLAILDAKAARGAASRGFALAASACALAAVLVLASFQPVRAQDPAAGDFDAALARARDAVVAAEKRHGASSPEFARALVEAGNALLAAGDSVTAAQSFERAAAILGAAAPGDPALAEALYRAAIHSGDRARLESALAAARRTGRDDIAARALFILAQRSQTFEPAMFEEAILIQSRLDQPAILAGMLQAWAAALRKNGRAAEADAAADRARLARDEVVARKLAAPPRAAGVHRVGGGVQPPKLLAKREPDYSEEARAAKFQGTVVLYIEVGTDGLPRSVRVLRPLGLGLDEQAVRAVRGWRFEPGLKDGQPVDVAATVEVNFRLL